MARPMNKAEVLEKLSKISDDEPLFLVRAQDISAASLVRQWIEKNIPHLGTTHEKILSAESTWYAMCAWPIRRKPD